MISSMDLAEVADAYSAHRAKHRPDAEGTARVLLDIQQVLPLPEAADYQVQLRRKDVARERARSGGRDFTRYHAILERGGAAAPEQASHPQAGTGLDEPAPSKDLGS